MFNINNNIVITRADSVYVDLRQRIIECNIASGHKLSEPELSKHYQISRTTLREALLRVESCGLVTHKPNQGYSVITLTQTKLAHIFPIFESLQGLACRLATQNMATEELQNLKIKIHNQQHSKTKQSHLQVYFECHNVIVKGSNNPMLMLLLCERYFYLLQMFLQRFIPDRLIGTKLLSCQTPILQAMQERDSELAQLLMNRQVGQCFNLLKGLM